MLPAFCFVAVLKFGNDDSKPEKQLKSSWEVQASIQHHFAKMMVIDFQANQFQKIHVNPK